MKRLHWSIFHIHSPQWSYGLGLRRDEQTMDQDSKACSGLTLTQLDQAVAPPANVAALVRVTHCDGRPLEARIQPENFTLSEDGFACRPTKRCERFGKLGETFLDRQLSLISQARSIDLA